MKTKLFFLRMVTVALSAASMYSNAATLPNKLLGEPVPPTTASRTIVIDSSTKYVRVQGGETVKFVVGDREFAWHFDGPEGPFDLRQIAPAGALARKLPAYVSANPLYTGS